MPVQDDSTRTVRKRVRTGCNKCRTRRRKCDEAKPSCRNCLEKNFECKYSIQLAFHENKAITLGPQDASRLSRNNYSSIRFVDDTSTSSEQVRPLVASVPSISSTVIDQRSGNTESLAETGPAIIDNSLQNANSRPTTNSSRHDASPASAFHQVFGASPRPRKARRLTTSTESPTDAVRHENAIHGLLALSSNNDLDGFTFPPMPQQFRESLGQQSSSTSALDVYSDLSYFPETSSISTYGQRSSAGESVKSNLPTVSNAFEQRSLELLSYYRYHVAPWLDGCDLVQPFGIQLSKPEVQHPAVRFLILAIAAQCLSRHVDQSYHRWPSSHPDTDRHRPVVQRWPQNGDVVHYISQSQIMCDQGRRLTVLEGLLMATLGSLFDIVSNAPSKWHQALEERMAQQDLESLNDKASHPAAYDLTSAVRWAYYRLVLGAAMAGETSVKITHPNIETLQFISDPNLDTSSKLTQDANLLLVLCGRAVNIRHGSGASASEDNYLRGSSLLDAWRQLWDELHIWLDNRSHEFLSILELPFISEGDMPAATDPYMMIIFTTAAAVFSNQLYHTALLLLLQCKPRTLSLRDQNRETSISPLWHAQRICSIAVSNDGADKWHPTLLASFLLAAKYLTHPMQQGVILQHLAKVEEMTGWNFSADVAALKEYWLRAHGS